MAEVMKVRIFKDANKTAPEKCVIVRTSKGGYGHSEEKYYVFPEAMEKYKMVRFIEEAKGDDKKSKYFPINFTACFDYSVAEQAWFEWITDTAKSNLEKFIKFDSIKKECKKEESKEKD